MSLTSGSFTSILDPRTVKCNGGEAALLDTPFMELKSVDQKYDYLQRLVGFARFVIEHPDVKSTEQLNFKGLMTHTKSEKPMSCNCVWFPVVECALAIIRLELTEIVATADAYVLKGDLILRSVSAPAAVTNKLYREEYEPKWSALRSRAQRAIGIASYTLSAEGPLAEWSKDNTSSEVMQYVSGRQADFTCMHAALRWLALWCFVRIPPSVETLNGCRVSSIWSAMVYCKRRVSTTLARTIETITNNLPELVCVGTYALEQGDERIREYGVAVSAAKYYQRMLTTTTTATTTESKARGYNSNSLPAARMVRWEKDNAEIYKQPEPEDTPQGSEFDWDWAKKHIPPCDFFQAGKKFEPRTDIWKTIVIKKPSV